MKLQRRRSRALQPPKARLYILCLFFAAGILAGFLVRCALPVDDLSALSGYVTSYAQLAAQEKDAPALLQIVWAYVRYPAAVFLLGFTAWGVLFIPLVCAAQGFFPVVCGAVLCLRHGAAGRSAGVGGIGAAVPVCAAVPVDDRIGRICRRVAAGGAPEAGGERPATTGDLCVCAFDRHGGGMRPGAAAFCVAFAGHNLKERGVREI